MLIVNHFDKKLLRKFNENKNHLKFHNPDITITDVLITIFLHAGINNFT